MNRINKVEFIFKIKCFKRQYQYGTEFILINFLAILNQCCGSASIIMWIRDPKKCPYGSGSGS